MTTRVITPAALATTNSMLGAARGHLYLGAWPCSERALVEVVRAALVLMSHRLYIGIADGRAVARVEMCW